MVPMAFVPGFGSKRGWLALGVATAALAFVGYLIFPGVFERRLFVNEWFSALGFLIVLRNSGLLRWRKGIHNAVLVFIGMGLVVALVSLFRSPHWYAYVLNSVIVYSAFAYFFGRWLYQHRSLFLETLTGPIGGVIVLIGLIPSFYDKWAFPIVLPFLLWGFFRRNEAAWLIAISVVGLYIAVTYRVATAAMAALVTGGLLVIRAGGLFYCALIGGTVVLAATLVAYSPWLGQMDTMDFQHAVRLHPDFALDHNTVWRFLAWYESLVIGFPGNLWGIGFGARLYNHVYLPPEFGLIGPYATGAHNSFVTLIARMGIWVVPLFLYLYFQVVGVYYRYRQVLMQSGEAAFVVSFAAISAVTLFNVVLESRLLAGAYWLLLGFIACAQERLESERNRQAQIAVSPAG
jgi:hypothetical protein